MCPEREDELHRKPVDEHETELLQTKAVPGPDIQSTRGEGSPLPESARRFFEPRFGHGFSEVRIHTNEKAAESARAVGALAYTVGHDIFFGAQQFAPETPPGKSLLAHELTHVLQHERGDASTLRRQIELRPPGRGEASAFGRAQELVDRLNQLTTALAYRLEGTVLRYEVLDEGKINEVDRQMRALMDEAAVVPMRLITGAGYVQANPGAAFEPALQDSWISGYVDLDDLLASDDLGFKTQLVHFLTERAQTRNYERRIGSSTFTLAEFNRVHQRGYEAEERVLWDEIGDPTLRYLRSEEQPAGTWRVIYRSNEGYRIIKVFRNFAREIVPAETYAIGKDGRRMTIAELIAERRARAAPPRRYRIGGATGPFHKPFWLVPDRSLHR